MTTPERLHNAPPRRALLAGIPADHLGTLIAALLMAAGGWWGLAVLIRTQWPYVAQQWLFYVLVQLAVSGTVLPVVRWLNVLLTPATAEPPAGGALMRQAMWVGMYAATCAWLQIPRALNPAIALFLALAFVVLEVFLRVLERQLNAQDEKL